MTSLPAGEAELYRERYWVPRRPAVLLLGYFELVAVVVILITRPGFGSIVLGLVACAVIPVVIGVAAELGARRLWFIVGERTLRFARLPPFPATAVRDFEMLDGKRVDRARATIRGRSTMWNMRTSPNPNLRGSLAPKGVEHAVLIHLDPSAARMETSTLLIGTRKPDELVAALRRATGSTGGDAQASASAADRRPNSLPAS